VATALLVAGSTLTFGYLRLHPPARSQASFKALGYSNSCRQLTDGSFQLTHMSCDVHAVQLIEPWRPKWRQYFWLSFFLNCPYTRIRKRQNRHTHADTQKKGMK